MCVHKKFNALYAVANVEKQRLMFLKFIGEGFFMSVIQVSSAEVIEGGNLIFNVTLSEASLADITVLYRLVPDGLASGLDRSDINSFSTTDTFLLTTVSYTHLTLPTTPYV